ncbi:1,4-dihydroxy-2-naphthoate polyprenyltransferase [Marinilongibacter aquaticus]|uniref:1,4-dihydroxy-2-naphthoate polyprenyltransferase n=1 Tax=Marinilongibacter aquaticus TaxID=2975157 RepID=UPI0021BD0FF2|nr:1,4-dihydroxy-2-naphthoate polyprenyltransferase [Marinilongibacter aquaticus]UBM58163.1 1,4-dihydroxy-2-naphthoate polyprenyltransferase [Marinilongibacter aquaticus]
MNPWISAARPRTLPLALASIFMGGFLAAYQNQFNGLIFGLACLTTILLQVLSNFANDYGDTQNGADSADRIGPARAVQSGEITAQQMWKGIVICGVLALLSGLLLLYFAFRDFSISQFGGFLALGLLCILAAYTYTAGKKPYGYAGFGDISVFIFFGLVGVLGSYYLFTKQLDWLIILPAISCGLLSTGVLNLNNIRDINSDKAAGKLTIPTRIGKNKAILYHWLLLAIALLSILVFAQIADHVSYYFLLAFPLFLINAIRIKRIENPDPLLKQLALSTLIFVLLTGISLLF